jgi:hypothetical protein
VRPCLGPVTGDKSIDKPPFSETRCFSITLSILFNFRGVARRPAIFGMPDLSFAVFFDVADDWNECLVTSEDKAGHSPWHGYVFLGAVQ